MRLSWSKSPYKHHTKSPSSTYSKYCSLKNGRWDYHTLSTYTNIIQTKSPSSTYSRYCSLKNGRWDYHDLSLYTNIIQTKSPSSTYSRYCSLKNGRWRIPAGNTEISTIKKKTHSYTSEHLKRSCSISLCVLKRRRRKRRSLKHTNYRFYIKCPSVCSLLWSLLFLFLFFIL